MPFFVCSYQIRFSFKSTEIVQNLKVEFTFFIMSLISIRQLVQLKQTNLQSRLAITALEAKFECQLLLQHILNKNLAWLIAHENDVLPAEVNELFFILFNRRLNGEPIAYILGYREFYGLLLKVSTDTLIPRPDTETLVDAVTTQLLSQTNNLHDAKQSTPILDLGTGTGAIALAIAKNFPFTTVTAVDSSQAALNIAVENAQNLTIQNVQFLLSDWFKELTGKKFDFIVSNPPYIEKGDEHLQQGDLRFEPISALASGQDGLDDISQIIAHAPPHLNTNGWLMLEHGYNQAVSVASLFKQAGFLHISHVLDINGIKRVTIGQLNTSIEQKKLA